MRGLTHGCACVSLRVCVHVCMRVCVHACVCVRSCCTQALITDISCHPGLSTVAPPLHHGPSVPPAVIPLPPGTHLLFAQTGKIERIPLEGGSMKKAEAKALLHAPVSAASAPGGASGPSRTPPRGARPGRPVQTAASAPVRSDPSAPLPAPAVFWLPTAILAEAKWCLTVVAI